MSDLQEFYELLETIPDTDRQNIKQSLSEKLSDNNWCKKHRIEHNSIYFHDFLKALRELRISEYGYHPKNYKIRAHKR
jgi:hypothetical protein